ncbi:MAG: ribbon-helix-helix domain-containing protein [Acetobacteraceae bacterium]|nr:ribbon-helix-helix domain-containing protein [Acetobacteraceae bacterium]
MSWLVKRSFTLAGHRTSIALEPEFWQALEGIAAAQSRSLPTLISEIDAERSTDRPLASMLRIHALRGSH